MIPSAHAISLTPVYDGVGRDGHVRYEVKHTRLSMSARPQPGTLVWVSDGWDFMTGIRCWDPAVYVGVGVNRNYSSVLMPMGRVESKHNAQIHVGEYPPDPSTHETW